MVHDECEISTTGKKSTLLDYYHGEGFAQGHVPVHHVLKRVVKMAHPKE